MKEVRFNDKFWFGKYKNLRLGDIIKKDPKFVMRLMDCGKISIDDKSHEFLMHVTGMSKSKKIRVAASPPMMRWWDELPRHFSHPIYNHNIPSNSSIILDTSQIVEDPPVDLGRRNHRAQFVVPTINEIDRDNTRISISSHIFMDSVNKLFINAGSPEPDDHTKNNILNRFLEEYRGVEGARIFEINIVFEEDRSCTSMVVNIKDGDYNLIKKFNV